MLAQASNQATAVESLVVTMGVVAFSLVLAVFVVRYVRKKMIRSTHAKRPVFTLEEIRRLRSRGDLSQEEYESLKRTLGEGALS